jgi:hypothetical protein
MARRATTRAVAQAAEGGGLRVAIYLRRSTDEEHQPFSLEAQQTKLDAYVISQPGWRLVADDDEPATSYLTEIRDRIVEIINTGTTPERKTMCEVLLAELRIDGGTATPVVRVPLSRDDLPAILEADTRTAHQGAVRVRPPIVGRTRRRANRSYWPPVIPCRCG